MHHSTISPRAGRVFRQTTRRRGRNPLVGVIGLVVALMVGIAHRPVDAQTRVVVPSAPSCSQCSIVLTPILKIGDADGEGVIGRPETVTRDGQGRYYAAFEEMHGTISVFDAGGRYLQTIGRRGGGPGEYQFISMIHAKRGDTLLVFDSRNRRLTFALPTGQAVRSVRSTINPLSLAELESGISSSAVTLRMRIALAIRSIGWIRPARWSARSAGRYRCTARACSTSRNVMWRPPEAAASGPLTTCSM